ncbi:dihydrofolate reductase family protein [Intrasporangium mesophilum]
MGRLIYTAIASFDGYVADETGGFGWAAPDVEVHQFVNDLERDTATYLYGRRLYEVMAYWETAPTDAPDTDAGDDYARIWQAADKVVYSTTLTEVPTRRTTLERVFDPHVVAAFVAGADTDVSIGGPHLAAHALRAGIVDEIRMLRVPAVVGGGTAALPDGIRLDLELLDSRRFAAGTTYAAYAVRR